MPDSSEANPVLSVIIAIVSDTTGPADARHLADCLAAFAGQCEDPLVELIVPHLEEVVGLAEVRERFPQARFLPVPELKPVAGGREHHDVLRAHGLLAARGQFVALIEDHAQPDKEFCASVVAAHRESNVAAIGGAMENGIDRALNWAVYFCDFAKYQNPLPAGDSTFASDANVSYKRSALDSIKEVWETSFREVVVNESLRSRGERVILRTDIVVHQNRSDLRLSTALQERYIWGRSYAATRNTMLSAPKRLVLAVLSPLLPVVLTYRIAKTAWQRRRLFSKFMTSCCLIAMLQVSWGLGECLGYLKGIRA